jgi:hypothetical protein
MLTRSWVAATALTAAFVFTPSSAALADRWTNTECSDGASASCRTAAGTTTKKSTKKTRSPSRKSAQAVSGPRVCKSSAGVTVPCLDPSLGEWDSQGNCYLKPASPTAAQIATFGDTVKGPGSWFDASCLGFGADGGGLAWRPDGPEGNVAAPPPPPPVVVARQAANKLTLVTPKIGANPSPAGEQLVSLPTWLWLQAGSWEPQSATAAVPGVSVTATATPTKVTWSMGDGETVECEGPGTVFPAGGDPRATSPTCGHTYTQSSAGRPGSAFRVSATVSWSITWFGGGEQGELPAMETTADTTFQVAESQALAGSGSR